VCCVETLADLQGVADKKREKVGNGELEQSQETRVLICDARVAVVV